MKSSCDMLFDETERVAAALVPFAAGLVAAVDVVDCVFIGVKFDALGVGTPSDLVGVASVAISLSLRLPLVNFQSFEELLVKVFASFDPSNL